MNAIDRLLPTSRRCSLGVYLRAGAWPVAVGSAIADAEEPGEAARALLSAVAARA